MTDLSPHQDGVTFQATLDFLRRDPSIASQLRGKKFIRDFPLTYLAPFDLSAVPDGSVDYVISRTVLEHIPENQLRSLLVALKPKLAPDGLMIHLIDHSDHLEHADRKLSKVQFLTWSDKKHKLINWLTREGENRLRHHEYIGIFQDAGFEVIHEITDVHEVTKNSVKSMNLAPRYKSMSAEQIAILKSILVARARY